MREIILDTETTGLDPKSGHRIIEIGCVEMIDRVRTGNFFHTYINPERDVPIEAFRVHGISEEFLKDKPVFAKIIDDFHSFIEDAKLVIHNAAFDMKFLNHELEGHGKKTIPMINAIDTLLMARKKFPGSPANLDALCKRFKIDLSKRDKHGALLDAELLADVYIELLGGAQTTIDFKSNSVKGELPKKESKVNFPKRTFNLNEQDFENHQNQIKKIKNSIWSQN